MLSDDVVESELAATVVDAPAGEVAGLVVVAVVLAGVGTSVDAVEDAAAGSTYGVVVATDVVGALRMAGAGCCDTGAECTLVELAIEAGRANGLRVGAVDARFPGAAAVVVEPFACGCGAIGNAPDTSRVVVAVCTDTVAGNAWRAIAQPTKNSALAPISPPAISRV